MKILDTYWFNNGGIVQVRNNEGLIVYYIAGGIDNDDPNEDAEFIANWGNSFPQHAGDVLFNNKFVITLEKS